jgi:hypothetical protein
MEISDSRAFRPQLRGLELDRAQEKFLATVLRSPGLWARRQIPGAFGARLPGSVSPTVISSRSRAWNRCRYSIRKPT